MKKFALTTAVMLLGLAPLTLADEPTTKTNDTNCCPPANCNQAPCATTDKGLQCGDEAWLDIETLTIEAENGDPIAQYTVAYLIETGGENTAPNPEKATDWYTKSLPGLEKAAAEGHPGACRALARMYAMGKGVKKDHKLAEKYMKMYKELCEKKCKEKKDCCPQNPEPTPAN